MKRHRPQRHVALDVLGQHAHTVPAPLRHFVRGAEPPSVRFGKRFVNGKHADGHSLVFEGFEEAVGQTEIFGPHIDPQHNLCLVRSCSNLSVRSNEAFQNPPVTSGEPPKSSRTMDNDVSP